MTARTLLKSIKRVSLDTRSDERFQAASVGDVDADREQIREVLRDPDVIEKTDGGLGVELDQNIDVARALALASRDRAEQRRVTNPSPSEFLLVSAQRGDDLFSINAGARPRSILNLTHRGSFIRRPRARLAGPGIGSGPAMTGGKDPLSLVPFADATHCRDNHCASALGA
jgi:hypothetical protein